MVREGTGLLDFDHITIKGLARTTFGNGYSPVLWFV